MHRRLHAWTLGLILLVAVEAASRDARACSLGPDFLPPSNYELVRESPQIVLTEVVSSAGNTVQLVVREVLRGSALTPATTLTLEGITAGYRGASPPGDFSGVRRGALAGGCVAYDYRVGGQFLLLLGPNGPPWAPLFVPFARVNEEVTGPSDPWVAAVRRYVKVAALADPVKERAELERVRAEAQRSPSAQTPAGLADDILHHLTTPSAEKTFDELKALYDAAPDDRAKGTALAAIAARGDAAAAPLMEQLLKQALADPPRSAPLLRTLARYYDKRPDPARVAALVDLYAQAGGAMKNARWELMWTLVHHADKQHDAAMQRALATTDDEEAGRLAGWFARFPSPQAQANLEGRLGTDYEHKTELTFAIAAMGAKAPVDWALTTLKALPPSEHRWLAIYIVARSPLPVADKSAATIIGAHGDDLTTLIQGYAGAAHAHAAARLTAIGALPNLRKEERTWLERTVRERAKGP
jgi:hypothetical protein